MPRDLNRAGLPFCLPEVPHRVVGLVKMTLLERVAMRVIVLNSKDKLALVYVSNRSKDIGEPADCYYELPGGLVENTEDHYQASCRLVGEEIGCKIQMAQKCVATTEEWYGHIHQVSYLYFAKLVTDEGRTDMTEEELEADLIHDWAHVNGAIRMMKQARPISQSGLNTQEREVFFLESFEKLVKESGSGAEKTSEAI